MQDGNLSALEPWLPLREVEFCCMEFKVFRKNVSIGLGSLVLFTLFGLSSVQALSFGTLGIRPANPDPKQPFGRSWFIYTAEIGKEIQDRVDVTNLADASATVRVWVADAATTEDGAYTIKDEEPIGVGAWITFFERNDKKPEEIVNLGPEATVDLSAGETKTVDFVLKVPESAEVGDHMGAIMAQVVGTPGGSGKANAGFGAGVTVVTRVGARVYLTVPGELVRKVEFTDFSGGMKNDKFYFFIALENQGNVRVEPKGKIVVRDIFGKQDEIAVPTRVVFPKDKIVLPVEWEKPPLLGRFTALALAAYGSETITRQATFWFLPSQKVLLGIGLGVGIPLVLLVGFFVVRKIKRNRKKNEKENENL